MRAPGTWYSSVSPITLPGSWRALALVEALLHRCEACGALLVVDECFLDFLPQSEVLSAKKLLASPNLIILKAFTKLYGMAGVRLGYCLCSNTALLDQMQAAGQPWAVSSLAQAAGLRRWTRPPMWPRCGHYRAAAALCWQTACGRWACG